MDIKEGCAPLPVASPVGFKCIHGICEIVDETIGCPKGRTLVCLACAMVTVPSLRPDIPLLEGWHCMYLLTSAHGLFVSFRRS